MPHYKIKLKTMTEEQTDQIIGLLGEISGSFDLTDKEQFLTACNYKNLQPLWAIDNLQKGSKIIS